MLSFQWGGEESFRADFTVQPASGEFKGTSAFGSLHLPAADNAIAQFAWPKSRSIFSYTAAAVK
ncbi:hypothetical protein [Paenibacillus sp. S150]|uniref:hypothetical protein n=1 Tax=Paenibacillus sp. S150 TaxID=2749826 RepID=UPI001C599B37|nr:hypothetical protein [Paenibacillus sp. S150]MBW4080942.1 hypothetical protein [Paenibacillus sp. S150]